MQKYYASPPTTAQVLAQQKADAEAKTKAAATGTAVAVREKSTAIATTNQTSVTKYLDEIAPATIVGRMIKFSKEGRFVTADDDQPIAEDAEFVALAHQTMVGWIKFNEDEPPTRVMGLRRAATA
jgi:hypothetical protein